MTDALDKAAKAVDDARSAAIDENLRALEARIVQIESKPEVEFDLTPVNTRLDELNDIFNGRLTGLDERVKAFETKHETTVDPDDEEVVEDKHEVETPVASASIENTARIEQAPRRKHTLFHRFGR